MKRAKCDELRPEYKREDLGPGVRGKYYQAYQMGTNLVLLNPDVAVAFPTEKAVNEALRSLMDVARRSVGLTRRSTGRTKKRRAG
jgi:hypothetical protein